LPSTSEVGISSIRRTIAFRVDWSHAIGLGHIQRCMCLMDALRADGFDGVFLLGPEGHACTEVFRDRGLEVVDLGHRRAEVTTRDDGPRPAPSVLSHRYQKADAARTVAAIRRQGGVVVVLVDHYGFDATWETSVHTELGVPVVAIDGLANRLHTARLVIDPTYVSDEGTRWVDLDRNRTRLLRGPRHAPIAPAFGDYLGRRARRDGDLSRILVNFGGSDHLGMTEVAIAAIERMDAEQPHVDVVVGAAHLSPGDVERRCSDLRQAVCHHATSRMAELMVAADLAIGSGGLSTYERAFLGLPALVVVTAGNQQQQLAEAERVDALQVLGSAQDVTATSIYEALMFLKGHPERVRAMGIAARAMMGNANIPGSIRIASEISRVAGDRTDT